MRIEITAVALAVAASVSTAAQPIKVDALTFAAPAEIAEIDIDKLKGQPARLAWSPAGDELYLQMLEGQFGQSGKVRHYTFNAASGKRQDLPSEPAWASDYWTAKSAQASPDGPSMKIDLKTETRTARTTAAPMGGDLARGGSSIATGTSAGDGVSAAYARENMTVHSMILKGEVVGEFVNAVIVPGLTFGWGPAGSHVVAYVASKSGRVVVMDSAGTKKEIDGTKDALLPAWSPDRTRLAWLQKDGRKKFVLQVARALLP